MRAAIVGGIIAIISLAAYGIVQAGWWPRSGPVPPATQVQALEMQTPQVEVPQVVAFVPVAPLDEAMPQRALRIRPSLTLGTYSAYTSALSC
jgi:hypothetical protein